MTTRVFISQPMKDKSDKQILDERLAAIDKVVEILGVKKEDIAVIDSFFQGAPHDAAPLWFLGKSIQLLSTADVAYFVKGWDEYRGCKIEHLAAAEYGIKTIEG
jgi:hypothetical protein